MVNIVILKRAGYRIKIVSMLFLFVSRWGADDSVLIQHLFLWNSDRLNETLESFISGGGGGA
jgi:hypothetical protein